MRNCREAALPAARTLVIEAVMCGQELTLTVPRRGPGDHLRPALRTPGQAAMAFALS